MKAVCLRRYPVDKPAADDFALVDVSDPVIGDGEVLVQVTHLSMDPMPRVRMQARSPFGPPMALGQPVEGRGVGRVVATRSAALAVGDLVIGELGWQELAALAPDRLTRVEGGLPHQHLNALGPTGLAAWFLVEALAPRAGQTLLVAPAAGAVGSLVCQMARIVAPDLKIYGTAKGAAQAAFLRAMTVEPIDPDLDLPTGIAIDLFVDGVGGAFHDRVLPALNARARILLLGFIAGYGEAAAPRYGNAGAVLMKRASMEGFLLADHMARADVARAALARWLDSGALMPAEVLHPGLAAAPHVFAGLFADGPPGKQIIALGE